MHHTDKTETHLSMSSFPQTEIDAYMEDGCGPHIASLKLLKRFQLNLDQVCTLEPHRWFFHLVVVVGLVCTNDPESYAGGIVATGRASQAGQVKG
jgi:hypothetical protein